MHASVATPLFVGTAKTVARLAPIGRPRTGGLQVVGEVDGLLGRRRVAAQVVRQQRRVGGGLVGVAEHDRAALRRRPWSRRRSSKPGISAAAPSDQPAGTAGRCRSRTRHGGLLSRGGRRRGGRDRLGRVVTAAAEGDRGDHADGGHAADHGGGHDPARAAGARRTSGAAPSAAPEAAAPWTASSCRRRRRAGARHPVRRWPARRQPPRPRARRHRPAAAFCLCFFSSLAGAGGAGGATLTGGAAGTDGGVTAAGGAASTGCGDGGWFVGGRDGGGAM